MNLVERERAYIRKWRKLAQGGDGVAMMNVAAAYRLLGNTRQQFRWYKRAAELRDAEAMLEVGYCYQFGVGVRRDENKAEESYRSAIAETKYITQSSRGEAMYFLAVLLLQTRPSAGRREILNLLRRANLDRDYPQAADLSGAVRRNEDRTVCVCRRDLMRRIATRSCSIHRKRAG